MSYPLTLNPGHLISHNVHIISFLYHVHTIQAIVFLTLVQIIQVYSPRTKNPGNCIPYPGTHNPGNFISSQHEHRCTTISLVVFFILRLIT